MLVARPSSDWRLLQHLGTEGLSLRSRRGRAGASSRRAAALPVRAARAACSTGQVCSSSTRRAALDARDPARRSATRSRSRPCCWLSPSAERVARALLTMRVASTPSRSRRAPGAAAAGTAGPWRFSDLWNREHGPTIHRVGSTRHPSGRRVLRDGTPSIRWHRSAANRR